MRAFDWSFHDGIILDDVRDLDFLAQQQDKVQGNYDVQVEFATTPAGHRCLQEIFVCSAGHRDSKLQHADLTTSTAMTG